MSGSGFAIGLVAALFDGSGEPRGRRRSIPLFLLPNASAFGVMFASPLHLKFPTLLPVAAQGPPSRACRKVTFGCCASTLFGSREAQDPSPVRSSPSIFPRRSSSPYTLRDRPSLPSPPSLSLPYAFLSSASPLRPEAHLVT